MRGDSPAIAGIMQKLSTYKLASATLFEDRQQPWRSIAKPWDTFPIPSMVCEDELLFLYYLASRHYTGAGCIVDMGPLAGGSTLAMAAGMRGGHIHSYDLWQHFAGIEAFFGPVRKSSSVLPHFMANTKEFADRITPHEGDIMAKSRPPQPIELMFVDAAKSPWLMRHIANEFFPHLLPGAYVVHQDFVSAENPWIQVAMGMLADHFEMMDSPDGGSVCFRVVKKIPADPLPADYLFGNRHHIRAAWQALPGWHGLCVQLGEAHYMALSGYPAEASQILSAVQANPMYEAPRYAYDVGVVQAAIAQATLAAQSTL